MTSRRLLLASVMAIWMDWLGNWFMLFFQSLQTI